MWSWQPGKSPRRVLRIRRKHDPSPVPGFAGGLVDEQEDLEAAARRSFTRGTGLESVAWSNCTPSEHRAADPRGHTISVVYLAE